MCKYNVIWPLQGFTCVNVCSLYYLEYKNWLDMFSVRVCVCVVEILVRKFLLRDDFESLIC